MKRRQLFVAVLSISAMAWMAGGATAATFNANLDGTDFTVVEVDPFPDGGAEGNAGRADGSGTFWSTAASSNSDDLWRERSFLSGSGWGSIAGSTDRLFEISQADLTGAPDLRLTVSGLAPENYQVVVLYTARDDNQSDANNGVVEAILNGSIGDSGTLIYTEGNASSAALTSSGTDVWATYYGDLGLTGGGATGFTVDISGVAGFSRTHAIGVAYRIIPEPASLALLGLGGVMMLKRRRTV